MLLELNLAGIRKLTVGNCRLFRLACGSVVRLVFGEDYDLQHLFITMDQQKEVLLSKESSNINNSPEALDIVEDSGFGSIAGSFAEGSVKDESISTIASNVKFKSIPMEEQKQMKKRRKVVDELELEHKQIAEKEYEDRLSEQRYKCLMHLLDRSQFYSNYLIKKFDESQPFVSSKKGKKRLPSVPDENTEPQKKSKTVKNNSQKYDIEKHIINDMKKKKATDKSKKSLNTNDITEQLMSISENEMHNVKSESETPDVGSFAVPKYFNGVLRDYQIEGLQWLKVLYENGVNGILADEMGLGKTIQVIALFSHLIEKRQNGPYLIVAPLSTIPNWLMEFEKFAPKLPVVLFHGDSTERLAAQKKIRQKMRVDNSYSTQSIVLTTYEVPIMEIRFLQSQKWRYIVVDEGQRIKNYKCQLIKILKSLQSMNRLLLTGTPLQNNLSELWSLLNFLLPEIFNDLAVFESWFDAKELQDEKGAEKVLKQEQERHVMASLREILKPFMLRRLKSDVCLEVPPKKEVIVYAPITELQHDLYTAILNRDLQTLSKIEKQDLIIPEVNGKRPKRKCVTQKSNMNGESSSTSISPEHSDDNSNMNDVDQVGWKSCNNVQKSNLSMWKKYTDVTNRNSEFLININFGNRMIMYKKVVNHPYLIHCPLDDAGLPKIDENLIKCSGKLLVLDAMLAKLKAQGHKILIFSTWTMILDMLKDYMELRQYSYVRLDGSQAITKRAENIKKFNTNPNVFIFLISTRAGGVGLNLAAADTVIMYDSDWNPQVDIQAMARCHRIGQTRPVVVYKLCTTGTVDERILKRGEAKRKLEKIVISKEASKFNLNDYNSVLELKRLLESSEHEVVTSEKDVFTPEELDKLLDRSDLEVQDKHLQESVTSLDSTDEQSQEE